MSTISTLNIRKLQLDCLYAGSLGRPHQSLSEVNVERELRKIAMQQLKDKLANALAPLDTNNELIVVIKRLELDFEIDLSLTSAQIAQYWAEKIKCCLVDLLLKKNSNHIAIFPNKANYIKCFIVDLIHSTAWQNWYYRYFDGTRRLTKSRTITTLLFEDYAVGICVLQMMSAANLFELTDALSESDAERLIANLKGSNQISGSTSVSIKQFTSLVAKCLKDVSSFRCNKSCLAFFLASHVLRRYGAANNIKEICDCSKFVSAIMSVARDTMQDSAVIVDLIINKNLTQLKKRLSQQLLTWILPVLVHSKQDIHLLINSTLEDKNEVYKSKKVNHSEVQFSRFGNALLLMQHFDKVITSKVWPRDATYMQEEKINLLRLMVISLCQGASQFKMAFNDPLLRELCGVRPEQILSDACLWLNDSASEIKNKFTLVLKERLLEYGGKISRYKFKWAGRSVSLTEEGHKGSWLDVSLKKISREGFLDKSNKDDSHEYSCFDETIESDLDWLWLDDSRNMHNIYALDNFSNSIKNKPAKSLLNDNSRLLLAQFSQVVVKDFAFRIPGFSRSTIKYLQRNFLGMSVTLVERESRFIAYLSKVPMSVMLNMAGVNRDQVMIPSFTPRPIQLQESV